MTGTEDFVPALTAAYRHAPCRVLPNALWKTEHLLAAGGYEKVVDSDAGGVMRLIAHNSEMLAIYWTRDRAWTIPMSYLETASLALVHADYAAGCVCEQFSKRDAYFRLLHPMLEIPGPLLPPGCAFATVRPDAEARAAADLIGCCYDLIHPSEETVKSWTQHPVHAPDLWVWVVDTARDVPVALGIAEFDDRVGEGSLEWIQILSAYRGLGVGRALVMELLSRLSSRADFVTVSGEAAGPGSPESFYRRCGFQGDDIWWVLRR